MKPANSRLAGLAIMLASLVALVMASLSGCQAREYARCQSEVTDALVRATSARDNAAAEDRAADRAESSAVVALIEDVFNSKSPEQSRAAYAAYRQKLAEVDAVRARTAENRRQHPLPEPPSEVCR